MPKLKEATTKIYPEDAARLEKWRKSQGRKVKNADFIHEKLDEWEQVEAGVLKVEET